MRVEREPVRIRILYIHRTLVPPPRDAGRDQFYALSQNLSGDVLHPLWYRDGSQVVADFGASSFPVFSRGSFQYHWFLASRYKSITAFPRQLFFYLSTGLKIFRRHSYDTIVVYSHMTTGLCGVALKWLTGAKLIIEIMTSPQHVNLTNRPRPTLRDRAMHLWSEFCLHVSVLACDRVHLLAPQQLSGYRWLRNKPRSVFPDFTPTSAVPRDDTAAENYVLLVGAPWYLKGADLAVKAFRRLEGEFPEFRLKLLGHFPDRERLDELIGDSTQIEVLKARPHEEAVKIMGAASILVHPSRCDGLPRVLMEAMSAGLPIVASDVGGIPHIVRDGENGYLVPVGNVDQLEDRLRRLMANEELREQMGKRGRALADSEFTEERYAQEFLKMIVSTVRGSQ